MLLKNSKRYFGSSETIREVTLTTRISKDDLDWFIGFAEGGGCLHTNGKRLWFILTQKEARILYQVRTMLGFGTINKTALGYFRYEVSNQAGLFQLITIFNRRLRTQKKAQDFVSWLSAWNQNANSVFKLSGDSETPGNRDVFDSTEKLKSNTKSSSESEPEFSSESTAVDTENAWISGFLDAEGGFSISIWASPEGRIRIRPRMFCDQKTDHFVLSRIATAFDAGRVRFFSRKQQPTQYRWMMDTWCHIPKIMKYFRRYPLRTKKHVVYCRWIKIYRMYERKEHLTAEGAQRIQVLSLKLNSFRKK